MEWLAEQSSQRVSRSPLMLTAARTKAAAFGGIFDEGLNLALIPDVGYSLERDGQEAL